MVLHKLCGDLYITCIERCPKAVVLYMSETLSADLEVSVSGRTVKLRGLVSRISARRGTRWGR